jgi:hypothetical protein
LVSLEGGRHPGWGTANKIVPLGDAYLELIAVIDRDEAAESTLGRWVGSTQESELRPLGWSVRGDVDDVAGRLDLAVSEGSRVTSDGQVLRWRAAGIERAAAEPSFPFFIEWAAGAPYPGRAPASHPAGRVRIVELQLQAELDRLAAWLGPHDLPIVVRPGAPALRRIVLSGDDGETAIELLSV